jgi:hypothetical protein
MHISPSILTAHFAAAGFVNVELREYEWPMSPWHKDPRLKEAGAAAMLSMVEDIEGMSLGAFTRFLGWEVAAVEALCEKVRKEWRHPEVRGWWPL